MLRKPLPLEPVDVVVFQNAPAGPKGVLVSGARAPGFEARLDEAYGVLAGAGLTVGSWRAASATTGRTNELIAFAVGAPPVWADPCGWTPWRNVVKVECAPPTPVDLTVWIVFDPDGNQQARVEAAIEATALIWEREATGLAIGDVEIVPAPAAGTAAAQALQSASGFDCTAAMVGTLRTHAGKRSDRINVYSVHMVNGDLGGGVACIHDAAYTAGNAEQSDVAALQSVGDMLVLGQRAAPHLLAHELGHLFSLRHIDGVFLGEEWDPRYVFDSENVMFSSSADRKYLTEGQTFRIHFDARSALNHVFHHRPPEQTSRNYPQIMPGSVDARNCPVIHKRIAPDGAMASQLGSAD